MHRDCGSPPSAPPSSIHARIGARGGANWLTERLTLAYRRDLDELLFERIFGPLGIQRTDLVWRKNQYRPDLLDGLKRRRFGAGISANVDHFEVLKPFFRPVVGAASPKSASGKDPSPSLTPGPGTR